MHEPERGPLLDRAQFEAARMMVARLRAEAADEHFKPADIGMKFAPIGDPVQALSEDGVVIRGGDFVRAALVLLWSMCNALAQEKDVDVADVVADLGIHVARFEAELPPEKA